MRRPLIRVVLPVLVIAGALLWSYVTYEPRSGVVVRAVVNGEPTTGYVSITKPQQRNPLAAGEIEPGKSARYPLDPGPYVVRPRPRVHLRAKPISVQVREGMFVTVVVRYRPVPARPAPDGQ